MSSKHLVSAAASFALLLLCIGSLRSAQNLENRQGEAHLASVTALSFSPDGTLLASASLDGSIKVWRVSDGSLVKTLDRHHDDYLCVAVSPDERLIATGTEDGLIRIWQDTDGQLLRTLVGHDGAVNALVFSQEGHLMSAGVDRAIKIWDLENGSLIHSWEAHEGPVRALSLAPRGKLIASGGGGHNVRIWTIDGAFTLQTETLPVFDVQAVAFSPDGSLVASAGLDSSNEPVVNLWDTRSGLVLYTITGHGGVIRTLAFSPDGQFLALGGVDRVISVWELQKPGNREWVVLRRELAGHLSDVRSIGFSSDGRFLISGATDQTIKIWRLETGSLEKDLERQYGPVTSIAVFPTGTRLASASYGATDGAALKTWDWEQSVLPESFSLRLNSISSLSFSSDSRRLLARADDDRTSLWALDSGILSSILSGEKLEKEPAAQEQAVSPDGAFSAKANEDGGIQLWNTSDNTPLRELQDFSTVTFEIYAEPLPVFRLDRAPLGSLRLTAGKECGHAADGHCLSSDTFVLLRFRREGGYLSLDLSEAQVRSSRASVVDLFYRTSLSDMVGLKLKPNIDFAAGDEIHVSGLFVTSSPDIYGDGTHNDWRLDSGSNQWERTQFPLTLLVYPELHSPVTAQPSSRPPSGIYFEIQENIVAKPLKDL